MNNGTKKVSPVSFTYPIKYLNEDFLPYESFLDNTILLIDTLPILIGFLFLCSAFLLIHCLSKIKAFVPFLYDVKKKR